MRSGIYSSCKAVILDEGIDATQRYNTLTLKRMKYKVYLQNITKYTVQLHKKSVYKLLCFCLFSLAVKISKN